MKANLLVAPGIIAFAFVLSANVASAQIADLLGEWHNIDSSTPGLTRVVITENGSEVALHAWGKCHPEDCDWGPVFGIVYGKTVRDNLISAAHAISAMVQTNFNETLLPSYRPPWVSEPPCREPPRSALQLLRAIQTS
jgi:hypothetical protein